ncbi:MAG: porin family protein [Pseudorhodoplanes sp.]|nr:porin family protein [Pseudorhodoplanes sp.]
MTRTIFAAAIAATLAASAAAAADLPRYYSAPPPPLAVYSWVGPYIGFNVGGQWGETTNNPTEPSGAVGGLQAGYNFQFGQFVIGAETDIQLSGAEDTFAPWKFSNPWFGTLRGRAGYALNNILFYGTGGLAYGGLKGEIFGVTESHTLVGWTAGAGMEVGFTPNWSAKVEYLYMALGEKGYSITGVNNGLDSNLLRFGVNYRF